MSDYGMNFGFLRSAEDYRTQEGRYRAPATGSPLMLGTVVEVDTTKDGFVKQSAANAQLATGWCGLLIQELDWDWSIHSIQPQFMDSWDKGLAKPGRLAVISSGPGMKFWVCNTPQTVLPDGRTIAARTLVATGLAAGDEIGWDGTKFVKVDGATITNGWGKVTRVVPATGRVEIALQA